MTVVYKYPLSLREVTVEMPKNARIVLVNHQKGTPTIWAQVDTGEPPEKRTFIVYGTGQAMPEFDWMDHVGSYVEHSEEEVTDFVWHVYERR